MLLADTMDGDGMTAIIQKMPVWSAGASRHLLMKVLDSCLKLTFPHAIIRILLNNELDVLEKSQSGSKALFNYSGHAW